MPIGDPVEILVLNEQNEMEPYYRGHLLKSNKTKSSECFEAGGEQSSSYVTFTLRWNKAISRIEYDTPSYRVMWRGQLFDVVGYDDFMYQHRKVDLACRSIPFGSYAEDPDE